jgi:DNA-binding GntR family transcriptional regulator
MDVRHINIRTQEGVVDILEIDRRTALPLHDQISAYFRSRIEAGTWPSGYRLPAEPTLAEELAVSRGTVRRAVRTLTQEGLVRSVQGKGTFVASNLIEPAIAQRLTALSDDYDNLGITTATEVISACIGAPPATVAALLDIANGGNTFNLRRRHVGNDGPIALLDNYVRNDWAPGIADVDFTRERLFNVLAKFKLRVATARRSFSAVAATGPVAEQLDVQEGAPVQYLKQVTYLADGSPIEYSDVWIRSDRLVITSLLSR